MQTFDRSLLGTLWGYALRLRARRNRVLAIRMLDSLPAALRKDIGWPDSLEDGAAEVEWRSPLAVVRPWPVGAPASAARRRAAAAEVVLLRAPATRHFASIAPTPKSPVGS